MQRRIFHGSLSPNDLARSLIAHFNQGNHRAQQLGRGNKVIVQIGSRQNPRSGGETALTVNIEKVADGISVELGKQQWLGVAASLGKTALTIWRNPWGLISRLDDIAQDIENLQLSEQVWEIIAGATRNAGATFELSERLRRIVCLYCDTANPVGGASCIACGAPLGSAQPRTCKHCGYVIKYDESICPNCGKPTRT